ncbi:MAG: hydrogenase maturation nickel metallochaperone HypA [Azovibrio sp.]|uniref:hydrogenase maturation nickel metallochaperone HypA n=1 Tax=Azovibrio sp. TaxID=1872673 RepID=UPI003C74265B
MHEMSLAEGILQQVEDTARREGARQVRTVVLEIGALASIEVEALRFCFDAVTRNSLAAGATLEIQTLPGAGWCLPCGATVPITELYDACPRCGSYQVQATAGTQMRIKEIEIE